MNGNTSPKHVRLRRMTGGRCYYCGCPTSNRGRVDDHDWLLLGRRNRMVREHGVPISRGGKDDASNIVLGCAGCNYDKGSFTIDEFRQVRAFQTGDLSFRFWGDHGPVRRRDWIVVHSPAFERSLVERRWPSAADGYALRVRTSARPLQSPRTRPVMQ